jgi:release factor glutamine methyltransferase
MLLMHVTGFTRIQLITRSDYQLSAQQTQQFTELQQRRFAGEPIAYLTGEREFFGLLFTLTGGTDSTARYRITGGTQFAIRGGKLRLT